MVHRTARRIVLPVAIVSMMLLNACTKPASDLPLLEFGGPVIGFAGTENLPVVALSLVDGESTLASGTLFAPPNPRVRADLTPLDQVPVSAFGDDPPCAEAEVTPANLSFAGFYALLVMDGGFTEGYLILANRDVTAGDPVVGDAIYGHLLANVAGRVKGTCDEGWSGTWVYDLEVVQGWNTFRWRIDAIGEGGIVTQHSMTTVTPPASANWYFTDVFAAGTLGVTGRR